MSGTYLQVTFIDVGFGDSVLIEARDKQKPIEFALVDCNDSTYEGSSRIFLKRRFERLGLLPFNFPMFKHVFTSHAHADHIKGIQGILKRFGTKNLYSSRCETTNNKNQGFANLIRWANKPSSQNKVNRQAYLCKGQSEKLGAVLIDVLWPPSLNNSHWDVNEENNNSLVLALTLDKVRFVLSADCLAENWDTNKPDHVALPTTDLRLVQVPHHGAYNGTFDSAGKTPMLAQIAALTGKKKPSLALSSHPEPHGHPHKKVIPEIDKHQLKHYQTNENYHLSFWTDGTDVKTYYSHE
jgi:beta-lactamase superfamily II metal-dependent hydrolase